MKQVKPMFRSGFGILMAVCIIVPSILYLRHEWPQNWTLSSVVRSANDIASSLQRQWTSLALEGYEHEVAADSFALESAVQELEELRNHFESENPFLVELLTRDMDRIVESSRSGISGKAIQLRELREKLLFAEEQRLDAMRSRSGLDELVQLRKVVRLRRMVDSSADSELNVATSAGFLPVVNTFDRGTYDLPNDALRETNLAAEPDQRPVWWFDGD